MCGPSGIGLLWGRAELLQAMDPFLTGGHMIRSVRLENESTWGELPHKFEAGTAPMAEAVGLGAAIDYLEEVGLEAIEQYEHELVAYALDKLGRDPGHDEPGGRRPSGAPASSASTSRASTRTTSRRSSTSTPSRSAPATTAASR